MVILFLFLFIDRLLLLLLLVLLNISLRWFLYFFDLWIYLGCRSRNRSRNRSRFSSRFGSWSRGFYWFCRRIYEGQLLDNKRNEQGYETYKNGSSYRGGFVGDRPYGKGIYTWTKSELFHCDLIQEYKNSFGVWNGLVEDNYVG